MTDLQTEMPPAVIIVNEAENIELRRFSAASIQEKYDLIESSRASLAKWLPWAIAYELETASARAAWANRRMKSGELALYDVHVEGVMVGEVSLHSREGDRIKMGYWLGDAFRGRNIMGQAAITLADHAFDVMDGIEVVALHIQPGNQPSESVARRIGAELAATVAEDVPLRGLTDYNIWEIHRDDRH